MKQGLYLSILLVLTTLLLAACGSSQEETNPAAVIEAGDAAWEAKDLEGFLELYAEDAVESNSRGLFYRREEIHDIISAAIDAFALDCGNYIVGKNKVYYECLSTFYSDGRIQGERWEAVVVDGKILVNISKGKFTPQKEFKIDSTLP